MFVIVLTYDIKIIIYHASFLLFLTFYVAYRASSNVIQCFSWWRISDVTSEILNFNIACELSQPMGKSEFSSTVKKRTNPVSQVRKNDSIVEDSTGNLFFVSFSLLFS